MTSKDEPSVDVVLSCYNEGSYIGQAIRSILNQTQRDRLGRIVVADDGSGPDTTDVLKDIETWDPKVSVLYGRGGAGPAAQRNLAIASTDAPYVAILDGDDYWTETKLEQQLPLLDADLGLGLIYSDYYAFPADNPGVARRAGATNITGTANQSHAYFLCDPPILPSTVTLRRSIIDRVGGFDPAIRMFEETDLWFRMAQICRFGFVDAPLLYKRYHPESLTGGRRDLMPEHTFVAMKAVSHDPTLLPFLPHRLSERARKLGGHRFLQGDIKEAARLLHLAVQLQPFNIRAWPAWAAAALVPNLSYRLIGAKLRRRRRALGIEK